MPVEEAQQQPSSSASAAAASATVKDTAESTKTLRRACDCCRKRKVKCDGSEPCTPCKRASIRCAYLQPPKKKGPKGLRSARVLHALRRIDDTANGYPVSPVSPNQSATFGNWGWSTATTSPTTTLFTEQVLPPPNLGYGPTTSAPPEQTHFAQQLPPVLPQIQHQQRLPHLVHPSLHRSDTHQSDWTSYPESASAGSEMPYVGSPSNSDGGRHRLPGDSFLPYIRLFFDHMFPIMPVIDSGIYLNPAFYTDSTAWSQDTYCFLCSICAATIVQLDASIPQPLPLHPTKSTDELFAEECLLERRTYDYVEPASTLSVMTSFFLFAYYGNHEQHSRAWFYLQESITFSDNISLDDEPAYAKLDPVEAQWRRRLYWLLFITERAYAVQRRKHARLHANIGKPAVFESEDAHLLTGFVNLANLFSAVDDSFVSAWRGSRRQSLCNEAWLSNTQKQLDAVALALDMNVSETQQLDISVTREWLHVLAWQMGVSNGLIWGRGDGGMRLDYPIELARKVVDITSGANALALDSHGIGMEQKLSDIAGCLADVLRCTAGDTSATFLEGKHYLSILLQRLSSIRGKESRYLKPLMSKLDGLMGYELDQQTLPLPVDTPQGLGLGMMAGVEFGAGGGRLSMAESVGMLRTLSMSGGLGMPRLDVGGGGGAAVVERRPSGRVYDEYETKAMGEWLMSGV